MDNIQVRLQRLASQYGVQIVDVRIKHADLPDGSPLDSALARMRTARQQQAITIRAQGQKDAQIIRADSDANAARIYAQSFTKDADFYDFYRAMQSYRVTFGGQRRRGAVGLDQHHPVAGQQLSEGVRRARALIRAPFVTSLRSREHSSGVQPDVASTGMIRERPNERTTQ